MHCLRKFRESAGLNYYTTIVYCKKTLQEQVSDPEAAQIFCVAINGVKNICRDKGNHTRTASKFQAHLTACHSIFVYPNSSLSPDCQCLPFIRTNFRPRATLGGRNTYRFVVKTSFTLLIFLVYVLSFYFYCHFKSIYHYLGKLFIFNVILLNQITYHLHTVL